MPLVAQTKPIIKLFERMPVYPDTISGQNFIRPDEVLEVQFGCYKYGKIPPQAPMIFYISYYDIDENEYLTITPQISGFDNIFSNPSEEAFLFDTLRFLASDLFFYEYKTLENTKFRIKGGSFRDEFLQKR